MRTGTGMQPLLPLAVLVAVAVALAVAVVAPRPPLARLIRKPTRLTQRSSGLCCNSC